MRDDAANPSAMSTPISCTHHVPTISPVSTSYEPGIRYSFRKWRKVYLLHFRVAAVLYSATYASTRTVPDEVLAQAESKVEGNATANGNKRKTKTTNAKVTKRTKKTAADTMADSTATVARRLKRRATTKAVFLIRLVPFALVALALCLLLFAAALLATLLSACTTTSSGMVRAA
ncbi:hypothetical protein BDU57DRAFT_510899 [Ampelomyces quisqualis]|uniref:Uncharacterized protein n=1 Tax=Ampelomyces quisqualis TaxID=50730 RepID=A0A6A5R530_AMPQU|nr:hypothetical protein BDU57DRAFT_510899 [Ampelomyces quisqualis]